MIAPLRHIPRGSACGMTTARVFEDLTGPAEDL